MTKSIGFIAAVFALCALQAQVIINPFITFPSAGGAPTYLVEEDMEGTGTPSGWTDAVSPDWDFTTSPVAGSESWYGDNNSDRSDSPTFTAQSTIYVFDAIEIPAGGGNQHHIELLSSGVVNAVFDFRSDGDFRIEHGSANAVTTSTPGSAGGVFYVWIHYTAGSGSDGTMDFYYSSTTTKPGAADLSITTGTSTGSIDQIRIRGHGSGFKHDTIRVDDEVIGSNPS